MTETTAETRGFQTEAKKLLKLMINSLYSNREIFLRELISNASDAIDRLRFEALNDESLIADDPDFRIVITFDRDAGTVSIADNGIGMSREEAVQHLGTIAKSGTEEFFDRLTGDQRKDSALIGQFGVGFYSCFIVAKEVEVLTRRAGDEGGTRWTSAGEDEFTVEDAADLPRGTQVILHLKADADEFADGFRLRSVVRRYSDHVGVPVMMAKEAAPGAAEDDADEASGDANKASDEPEMETVNAAKALWTRPRNDIGADEYKEFYKHISHDFDDPAVWSHNRVEGKLEYTSLLYVPKRAPFDLWNRELPRGLKLYVQRVFIMDEADQFLPLYLRFVRGIVDSSDLPLNVSREILQQDDRVRSIKNALSKRVLDMLAKMDADAYGAVWDEFGQVLKEGIGEDFANKDALLGLLRFASTHDADPTQRTSLKDYIGRMAATVEADATEDDAEDGGESGGTDDESGDESRQDAKQGGKIYYLIAESDTAARQSPHLEAFRERGIEVLLLTDRIDEWWMSFVSEFDGKTFQDVARGELDFDDKSDDAKEGEDEQDDEPLLKRIGDVLNDKVESVRKSRRLKDSPACLVLGEHDMGAQMRRILEVTGQQAPDSKPHFEVNLDHPLIVRLDTEPDEDRFKELVSILFDQASLAEGNAIAEPGAYVQRINKLLVDLMGS